jgi:hypothetical protein
MHPDHHSSGRQGERRRQQDREHSDCHPMQAAAGAHGGRIPKRITPPMADGVSSGSTLQDTPEVREKVREPSGVRRYACRSTSSY